MTGSALAPVVIPIVAFVFLFAWLAIVYYAAAHPRVGAREGRAAGRGERAAIAHEDSVQKRSGANQRAA